MLKRRLGLFATAAAVLTSQLLVPGLSLASASISQSYGASTSGIAPGTVLDIAPTGSSTVQPATSSGTVISLVGVAVTQPVLELSSGKNTIQVAVGGTAPAFVSDINGPVSAGDKLTASPIAGVAMKALSAGQVLGTAQASLGGVETTTKSVTDRTGKQQTVKIGLIPILVNVAYFSGTSSGYLSSYVPSVFQNLADAIAGKPVSPARVLIGLIILVLGFVTIIVMLNSAVRSGIISLGRNPMAGRAIRTGLIDVIVAALGMALITGVLVYGVVAL